jgi:hypothetical protein
LLLIFFVFVSQLRSQSTSGQQSFALHCLKIEGKLLNEIEKGTNNPKIELICDNQVIDSVYLRKGKKKFSFILKSDKYYTIKINLDNHLNKLVCVDTRNVKINSGDDLYGFSFETTLIHQNLSNHINQQFANTPIAIIYFNNKLSKFDYNKEYTNKLKRDMQLSSSRK